MIYTKDVPFQGGLSGVKYRVYNKKCTHIMKPGEFPSGWVGTHVTLKVDIIALLDISSRQRATQA